MKILRAIYDFVTDANGDGDIVKLFGAVLMAVALIKFAIGSDFDTVAFGAGAASAVAAKGLDAVIPKTGA